MRRRRILFSKNYGGINSCYADICYYNAFTDEFIIVDIEDIDDYSADNYTPIGIVTVPSSHTDNQRPRIMSLVHMNCNTPKIVIRLKRVVLLHKICVGEYMALW